MLFDQLARVEPQPVDLGANLWPDMAQKHVALLIAQAFARPFSHKHADAAPDGDKAFVL